MPKIKKIKNNIITITSKNNYEENGRYQLSKDCFGIVLSATKTTAQLLSVGDVSSVKINSNAKKIKSIINIDVYEHYFGKIINPFGDILYPKNSAIPTENKKIGTSKLENNSISIMDREKLSEPLETGIIAIDATIPIGKGQRELIIGDRNTGKTSIALTAIINQKTKKTKVIYVSIGQKRNSILSTYDILKDNGVSDNLIFIHASSKSSSEQYYAPSIGMAMAETLAFKGNDVLIVIDDLSKHANVCREISLSIGKFPGREAYPTDMFFKHSSLLERAGKFSSKFNNGTITCIPIVETIQDDIASVIASNIISITDGQIFTSKEKFNNGIFPAINIGKSVSRTGSSVQSQLIKGISKGLKSNYSTLYEISKFANMSIDITDELSQKIDSWNAINNLFTQYGITSLSKEMIYVLIKLFKAGKLSKIKIPSDFSIVFNNYCKKDPNAKKILNDINAENIDTKIIGYNIEAIFEPLIDVASGKFGGLITPNEYERFKGEKHEG